MKILFVYPNSTKSVELPLGIAYLSASLKQYGYVTNVLDLTWNPDLDTILRTMKGHDILAISCGTLEYQMCLNIARIWKKYYDLPVLIGGCHAITCPEEVIMNPYTDAICIGEGEEALAEFVELYEDKHMLPLNVHNFWVKQNGKIHRNPLRHLTEDLDTLPFPDRTVFDKRHIENKYPGTSFLTSRGCPFHCSMCINHYLQRLFKGLGQYTRFRSIDNLFQEITQVTSSYNVKCILFADDTFTVNRKRLDEFCRRYPKDFDLPFIIMGRCNTVTKELVWKLKKAGCIQIAYGLEAGNDFIRNKILNRNMSKSQIVNAFKWTREAGIKTVSFNMIGIPFEDRKKIFDTVNLNRLVKPSVVQTTLLYPFPKTDIHRLAQQHDMLEHSENLTDYYSGSVIKLSTISNNELYVLSLMMPFYIHMPKIFHPLIRVVEGLMVLLKTLNVTHIVRRGLRFLVRKVLERSFWSSIK